MQKKLHVTSHFLKWTALFLLTMILALPVYSQKVSADSNTYRVTATGGYLALRSAKANESSNEIGKLYKDDIVEVSDYSDSKYWYVYSSKLNKSGYVNNKFLEPVAVASSAPSTNTNTNTNSNTWTVKVDKGYLALRTAKAYDSSNEIGELYTGDTVEVSDYSDSKYWYVYSPKLNKYGYVNKDYLYGGTVPSTANTYTVKVDKGYLALRTAKAYDSNNEIGELYTGDVVEVSDYSDSKYWYVYSPKLNKSGYVNKDYLVGSSNSYTVKVDKGYLALRTAKAYDSNNEIGELYTGDTVTVSDTSDSKYWYVYSPKLNKYGYVNKDYLVGAGTVAPTQAPSYPTYTVKVAKGYLALRTAKAYDSRNEIGELYTGDTVQVQDSSDSKYWYVYSPKLNKYGYVNKEYLY